MIYAVAFGILFYFSLQSMEENFELVPLEAHYFSEETCCKTLVAAIEQRNVNKIKNTLDNLTPTQKERILLNKTYKETFLNLAEKHAEKKSFNIKRACIWTGIGITTAAWLATNHLLAATCSSQSVHMQETFSLYNPTWNTSCTATLSPPCAIINTAITNAAEQLCKRPLSVGTFFSDFVFTACTFTALAGRGIYNAFTHDQKKSKQIYHYLLTAIRKLETEKT
ncbi:MAG TPA: hypothetical protein VEK38_01440 [Candidatus Bathyarchaeia archaeon]|nr:hypothetical protein [Candidatus Bathyarchaeia archaeon]